MNFNAPAPCPTHFNEDFKPSTMTLQEVHCSSLSAWSNALAPNFQFLSQEEVTPPLENARVETSTSTSATSKQKTEAINESSATLKKEDSPFGSTSIDVIIFEQPLVEESASAPDEEALSSDGNTLQKAPSIRLQGIRLIGIADLNGVYVASSEIKCGMPIYHLQDGAKVIAYNSSLRRWEIKPTLVVTDGCWAFIECEAGFMLHEIGPVGLVWTVRIGGPSWVKEPSVTMDALQGREGLSLTGFVHQHASKLNGDYESVKVDKTESICFRKVNSDTFLEYHEPTKTWQLKPAEDFGRDACWAFFVSAKNVSPLLVRGGVWMTKSSFEPQPSARIVAC